MCSAISRKSLSAKLSAAFLAFPGSNTVFISGNTVFSVIYPLCHVLSLCIFLYYHLFPVFSITLINSRNEKNTGSGLFGSIRYFFISQSKLHQDYFTVIFRALYTPFCAYTHIVQVPLPVALIRPSGVTVATFVLLLS